MFQINFLLPNISISIWLPSSVDRIKQSLYMDTLKLHGGVWYAFRLVVSAQPCIYVSHTTPTSFNIFV